MEKLNQTPDTPSSKQTKGQQPKAPALLGGSSPQGTHRECAAGAPPVKSQLPRLGEEPQSILEIRREAWLREMEAHTATAFDRVSRAVERRGNRLRRQRLALSGLRVERAPGPEATAEELEEWLRTRDGENRDRSDEPTSYVPGVGQVPQWHASRARGLRRKWQRIEHCRHSEDYLVSPCGCQKVKIGCNQRECPKCRKLAQDRTQRRLRRIRTSLRKAAKDRKGDKTIRERLVTFTIPHVGSGLDAVEERIRIIFDAWALFADELRRDMREKVLGFGRRDLVELIHLWRVFEWTEGSDGSGHPHFHVWIHGPRLDQKRTAERWEACVRAVAGDAIAPDVRFMKPDMRGVFSNGVENELIKYMVKDLSDQQVSHRNQFVPAEVVSRVVMAMIRRRRSQTSRDLSQWDKRTTSEKPCPCCGVFAGPLDAWTYERIPTVVGVLMPETRPPPE